MGKRAQLKSQRAKRLRKQRCPGNACGVIKVGYWNTNGLRDPYKQLAVAEAMEAEGVDVMFCDETHHRDGASLDLSAFGDLQVYTAERGFGTKAGGGKIVLVNKRINHMVYKPSVAEDKKWIEKERIWVMVFSGNQKFAFCSVYLAAEVATNTDFRDWNASIYECLQNEVRQLEADGFKCMVVGDLNAHVGDGPQGIEGNRPEVNSNGRKLRSFIEYNGMIMINADKARCDGLFTRVTPNSSTILDYAIASGTMQPLVDRLLIDESGRILAGSDHAAIFVKVNVEERVEIQQVQEEPKPRINPGRDLAKAQEIMDRMMAEAGWELLCTEDRFKLLQTVLVAANLEAYGPRKCGAQAKLKPSRKIRRLSEVKRQQNRLVKDLSLRKAHSNLAYGRVDEQLQEQLDIEAGSLRDIQERLRIMIMEQRMAYRTRVRAKTALTSKQFWKLVKRTVKKAGTITTVLDEDGQLYTDRAMIEEITLRELAKIFNGQRSMIFQSRNQQLIREVTMAVQGDWSRWIKVQAQDQDEHDEEVCAPVTSEMIKDVLKTVKNSRAAGMDGVSAPMLKAASPLFLTRLTESINQVMQEGVVPECLLPCAMTLIDKKGPSFEIKDKRPLAVSSVMLSIITKVLNIRMGRICEDNNLFGDVQYGFRSNRSTSDCVFILLAAIRKAKRQRRAISIAFCDLAKAYDSVNREILYTKLRAMGFGGRTCSLIQSLYYNDSVQVKIQGGLTEPLWFTQGVKQGCCLSPLLFALYVAGLGAELHATELGVKMGEVVVTALFFADDLILISRTPKRGMERLLGIVQAFCREMCMTLSISKTHLLTTKSSGGSWTLGDHTFTDILAAKYLGVKIMIRGRNMLKQHEEAMMSKAMGYAHTIMNLTRAGLDRAKVATALWETCAIPAILYCVECFGISATTIRELERTQNMVARFVLQVPRSSSAALGWMDAGFRQMGSRIESRRAAYLWTICHKRQDPLLRSVLEDVRADRLDPVLREWENIEEKIGPVDRFQTKKSLCGTLDHHTREQVLEYKELQSTMQAAPEPGRWFKLQEHVNDSVGSKIICRARAGALELGNRYPNEHGKKHVLCPLCVNLGVNLRLRESHVLLNCPAVSELRRKLGISKYKRDALMGGMRHAQHVLRQFLGDDGAGGEELCRRGKKIGKLVACWMRKTIA